MFRRTFWFTAGAAAGVWATTKVNRKLKQLTPESLAARGVDKAIEAGHRVKDFALDVRAGMLQREDELNDALGLTAGDGQDGARPDNVRALPAQRRLRAIEPHQNHRPKFSYNRNEDH
ncbi:hypothetical protein [Streptomyces antimicrobicus]|uniref:Secreted protein n=1 Tax=Streptomyces antimicrobicus TaxID=2883108 RepID=A0ABS8B9S5_9ACTN|nr:hypothetical protein [Streptomyces antimicrobicus]MCB5181357.1 hypothetical protein [Streptomyces antimicrobicus]